MEIEGCMDGAVHKWIDAGDVVREKWKKRRFESVGNTSAGLHCRQESLPLTHTFQFVHSTKVRDAFTVFLSRQPAHTSTVTHTDTEIQTD